MIPNPKSIVKKFSGTLNIPSAMTPFKIQNKVEASETISFSIKIRKKTNKLFIDVIYMYKN